MASTRKRKAAAGCRVQLDEARVIGAAGRRVQLGEALVIGAAAELHARLGEALGQAGLVVLDVAAVTRLDTAGLQLLHAFVQAREEGAGEWRWENVGAVLREAAVQLGMQGMLKLPDAAPVNN